MLAVHVDQPSTAPDHQMALLVSVVVDHQMAQLFEDQDVDALDLAIYHQMALRTHQMALLVSVAVDHQMAQLFEDQDVDALVFAVDHQMLVSVVVDRQPTTTVQTPRVHATFRLV